MLLFAFEAPSLDSGLELELLELARGDGGFAAEGTVVEEDWEKLTSKGFCSRERSARLKGRGGGLTGTVTPDDGTAPAACC